jgi:AbrB family looped-hinge helix DNA binding protein
MTVDLLNMTWYPFYRKGGEIMTTTTVTAKGQIVIPSRIRQHLNIKKGTRLSIIEKDNGIVLKPLTREYFEQMAGIARGKRKLTDVLFEERRKDREAEDKKWSRS